MAVVALLSAKGSPGVTTTALGLAMAWPRPVILIEADTSGSSIAAGYLRGEQDHSRGMLSLAEEHYRDPHSWSLRNHTTALGESVELLLGVPDADFAPAVQTLWPNLVTALTSLEESGIDAIVDLGRVTGNDDRSPLLQAAHQRILITGSRLPDAFAARHAARRLQTFDRHGREAGLSTNAVAIIGPGRPYASSEITKVTNLPLAAPLPWDPVAAEVYSIGAPPAPRRRTPKLMRAYESAGSQIRTRIERNTSLLRGEDQ